MLNCTITLILDAIYIYHYHVNNIKHFAFAAWYIDSLLLEDCNFQFVYNLHQPVGFISRLLSLTDYIVYLMLFSCTWAIVYLLLNKFHLYLDTLVLNLKTILYTSNSYLVNHAHFDNFFLLKVSSVHITLLALNCNISYMWNSIKQKC